jgi:hypothetical protein
VTGNALLIDQKQHRVPVTIEPEFAQQLHLPGGLAFSPEPATRPRPVTGAAFAQGRMNRIAVHPRHHQDFACIMLLGYGSNEAIGTKCDRRKRLLYRVYHLSSPVILLPKLNTEAARAKSKEIASHT